VMYFLVLIGRLISILIQFLEYKFNSCVIFLSGWSIKSIFAKDPVYDNIKDGNENKMGQNTTPSKQFKIQKNRQTSISLAHISITAYFPSVV
jgi:hypothetical protein